MNRKPKSIYKDKWLLIISLCVMLYIATFIVPGLKKTDRNQRNILQTESTDEGLEDTISVIHQRITNIRLFKQNIDKLKDELHSIERFSREEIYKDTGRSIGKLKQWIDYQSYLDSIQVNDNEFKELRQEFRNYVGQLSQLDIFRSEHNLIAGDTSSEQGKGDILIRQRKMSSPKNKSSN